MGAKFIYEIKLIQTSSNEQKILLLVGVQSNKVILLVGKYIRTCRELKVCLFLYLCLLLTLLCRCVISLPMSYHDNTSF